MSQAGTAETIRAAPRPAAAEARPEPARKPRRQVGALPYRFDDDGRLQVMLITSRESRRWVIPKGWPVRGLEPHRAAKREASEEAGLKGDIRKKPVGVYAYGKRLASGPTVPCEVSVFPMRVTGRRKRWPEMDQREGRWLSPEEAAGLVQEEGLRSLLRAFKPATRKARGKRAQAKPQRRGKAKAGVKAGREAERDGSPPA